MNQTTIHNPDRFMVDLRQFLSQGKKRIGLLVGAGAPVALKVNADGQLDDDGRAGKGNFNILERPKILYPDRSNMHAPKTPPVEC